MKLENPLIVVKSDGGYGYDSTDMSAIWYRLLELRADWLIYVTDQGQGPHFELVFAAALGLTLLLFLWMLPLLLLLLLLPPPLLLILLMRHAAWPISTATAIFLQPSPPTFPHSMRQLTLFSPI